MKKRADGAFFFFARVESIPQTLTGKAKSGQDKQDAGAQAPPKKKREGRDEAGPLNGRQRKRGSGEKTKAAQEDGQAADGRVAAPIRARLRGKTKNPDF